MRSCYRVGDKASLTRSFTQDDVELFSLISRDYNPIHINEEYALNTRFKKRIVQGLLTTTLISAIIGNILPGNNSIYLSQTIEFVCPVFLNDTLTAEVEILDIRKSVYTLKTIVKNQDNNIVLNGQAKVMYEGGVDC